MLTIPSCPTGAFCAFGQTNAFLRVCHPSKDQIQGCTQTIEDVERCLEDNCASVGITGITLSTPIVDVYIINNTNAILSYVDDTLRYLPKNRETSTLETEWVIPPPISIDPGAIAYMRATGQIPGSENITFQTQLTYVLAQNVNGGRLDINVCELSSSQSIGNATLVTMGNLEACGNTLAATLSNNPAEVTLSFRLGRVSIAVELSGRIPDNYCLNTDACPLGDICENNRCVSPLTNNQSQIIAVVSITVAVVVILFLIFLVFLKNTERKTT
jgi:hypothetical protein